MQIRKRKRRTVPGLNMASMPDLIFTVLFFFMIVTHMRKEEVQVKFDVPQGTEVSKATKQYASINIYIGKDKHGQDRIQLNDNFVMVQQIAPAVNHIRQQMTDGTADALNVNIRADKGTPMGIINDVKMELRKAGALTVRYNATEAPEVQ